jgi:creatinine amidohydrolase
MTVEWAELKAAELRARAAEGAIVVVPVAAIEQHGPHLPVLTDSLLCSTVARRGAERAVAAQARPVLVTPTVWSGMSEHHMPFGGTLSLDFPTFSALIGGVCRSLQRHGCGRILLLNGHGGNEAALRVIVEQLSPAFEGVVACVNYWHLAAPQFAQILERQPGVQHACEAETSMVLALRPELVDPTRFAEASFAEGQGPGGAAYRWRSFAARTASGVIGDPTAASAEKGERLLEAAAAALAELLQNEGFWQRA